VGRPPLPAPQRAGWPHLVAQVRGRQSRLTLPVQPKARWRDTSSAIAPWCWPHIFQGVGFGAQGAEVDYCPGVGEGGVEEGGGVELGGVVRGPVDSLAVGGVPREWEEGVDVALRGDEE
jgi:hypothetical protein